MPISSAVVVVAVRDALTGTVLMNMPTADSLPNSSAGRPDTVVPKTTSPLPVNAPSRRPQAACSTMFMVVFCERANCSTERVTSIGRSTRNSDRASVKRSPGSNKVGV